MKTLPHTGLPRCTTFGDDLNIYLSAIECPFKTVREIYEQLNINASIDTFRRRLNENSLFRLLQDIRNYYKIITNKDGFNLH